MSAEFDSGQQMFWVHTRGLIITLPPQISHEISQAVNEEHPIPEMASEFLGVITRDSILKKRYPKPTDGENFMKSVDYNRRDELLALAQGLCKQIVETWNNINPNKDIAVLLYGSVARGLVKDTYNPNPSDIDLTVIGNFTEYERNKLMYSIHPMRNTVRRQIIESCPNVIGEFAEDIRYAGTLVQNREKLTKERYSAAIHYLGSCITPLYDPSGIWVEIERRALEVVAENRLAAPVSHRKAA